MYLGLDIGTSSVKGLLQSEDGEIVASHSVELAISRPLEGYSEQNPQDWINATDTIMSSLKDKAGHHLSQLLGIGLSGQMHGLVALDKADKILRPAILWNDARCERQARMLDTEYPEFRKIGGNAVMAGFTAPKAVWMSHYEAELFNRIKTILLPKDYVRFWLTGEKLSDMSDASGTLWLDVEKRKYSEQLLGYCGLDISQMPGLREGSQPAGTLRKKLAEKWGITAPVVVSGAGDNAASACGLGVVCPGDAFLSLGTSGVIFSVTDKFLPSAENGVHAFCHAFLDVWHQMGVVLSATDSLNWLSEITGHSVASLATAASTIQDKHSSLMFHPYLSGERTPLNDAIARAGFIGLARSHTHAEMAYAVLEGVSYAMAECADVLAKTGQGPSSLLAVGGGSKNHQWLQLMADTTGLTIHLPMEGEFGGALGAARLGAIASGASLTDILTKPNIKHIFHPRIDYCGFHNEKRNRWRATYNAIKSV